MNNKKKRRFERWRATQPEPTRLLADLVAERLLPEFEAQGFIWHANASAGFLYLVKPGSSIWPAVEMRFHKRAHPMLFIDIACLPETCRQWDGKEFVPVPRAEAHIVDAPVVFWLCNRRKLAPNFFGYRYFSLLPKRRLRNEIATVESLLPRLFDSFEEGLLLDSTRWPELQNFLTLTSDRRQYFDSAELTDRR